MVLVYFIETETPSNRATPFNILPLHLARQSFALELAALLPSSHTDLSFGWARPRHLLGFTPIINSYSEQEVGALLKTPSIRKQRNKFFLARKDFSIPLIEQSSSNECPSIVVTDNKHMVDYFQENPIVNAILWSDDRSVEEVYRACYQALLEIFVRSGEHTVGGRLVSMELQESYSLSKDFLPETQITANLLCHANEVVLAQVRGRLPRTEKDFPRLDTDLAYFRNIELMEEILAERLTDLLLAVSRKELGEVLKNVPPALLKSVGDFLERANVISPQIKKEKYLLLKQIALDAIKDINARTEVTLLIPTVNPFCRKHVISELEKDVGVEHKKELAYAVDRVLNGGRGVDFDREKLGENLVRIAEELANTRIHENEFLTNLVALLASRKVSPVLKTVTAPSILFDKMQMLRNYVGLNYLAERNNPEWCMTIGEMFRAIQKELNEEIPQSYIDSLESFNPSYITVVSDLPFEIAQYNTELAVCQRFPTTRIPITPLGALFGYYNQISQRVFVGIRMKSLENVLIVNSLQKGDIVYPEFELFQSVCGGLNLDFKVRTAFSSTDFVNTLNSTLPTILVYFGHASYNVEKDQVELVFRDDRLSRESLKELTRMPPIIFLIGCETGSCSAFAGGLSIHLLGRGAFAVLATIFPVSADHAASFLGRMLAFSKDVISRGASISLTDLVFKARKLGWMVDNLDALRRSGTISLPEQAGILKQTSDELMELSKNSGKDPLISEAIPIFQKVLDSYDVLDTWQQMSQKVIPYSLFLTLLGDAHEVFIGT